MKNSKRIDEIEKNIEKMEKDLAEQKKLVAKLKNGKYEIGDEIEWCGFEWIFIGFNEDNKPKLMTKNVVETLTYSDNNSNDYCESNVRKYLETEFINKLDKSKLLDMRTNYDEYKLIYTKIRIPTVREIESLPMSIRKCGEPYWTMTSSLSVSEDCSFASVFYVNSTGGLGWYYVYITYGVRPVMTLSTDELL